MKFGKSFTKPSLRVLVLLLLLPESFLGFYLVRLLSQSSLILEQIMLVSGTIIMINLFLLMKEKKKSYEIMAIVVLIMAVITQFGASVVLNIDRSRSVFILSWVHNHEIDISQGNVRVVKFTSSEMENLDALKLRINEQVQRGLMKVESDRIFLSVSGKLILYVSQRIASIFQLGGWEQNT
jgi:hypothetical protein